MVVVVLCGLLWMILRLSFLIEVVVDFFVICVVLYRIVSFRVRAIRWLSDWCCWWLLFNLFDCCYLCVCCFLLVLFVVK